MCVFPRMLSHLVFLLASTVGLGVVILGVPDEYLTEHVYRLSLDEIYPGTVYFIQRKMKPVLEYGRPSETQLEIMELIESIPVEERMRSIKNFQNISLRRLVPGAITTDYHAYLVSLMFMDIRVYRVLARFASRRLLVDEEGLRSATDIIQHMKQKFPTETFDYLTPDHIIDWYSSIGNNKMRVYISADAEERATILDPNSTGPRLLHVSFSGWKDYILTHRLKRLGTTGYEFWNPTSIANL